MIVAARIHRLIFLAHGIVSGADRITPSSQGCLKMLVISRLLSASVERLGGPGRPITPAISKIVESKASCKSSLRRVASRTSLDAEPREIQVPGELSHPLRTNHYTCALALKVRIDFSLRNMIDVVRNLLQADQGDNFIYLSTGLYHGQLMIEGHPH